MAKRLKDRPDERPQKRQKKHSEKQAGKKSGKKSNTQIRTVGRDATYTPRVGIVMGSDSDLRVMKAASDLLKDFGVLHEIRILSAHRTPEAMIEYASHAYGRGLMVLIAGAGGAAHLPGMIASATVLPVIGVPVNVTKLDGIDAFLSIVQMPTGVPVATVAIDNASNAALLALRILGTQDVSVVKKLTAYKKRQAEKVQAADRALAKSRLSEDVT